MKICHVLWGLTYGGIETIVVNIANNQKAMGHEVHLLIINNLFDSALLQRIAPGVKFHSVGREPGSKNPAPILRLNGMLMGIHPDIVHFHHARMFKYVAPVFRRHWCVTHHTQWDGTLRRYFEQTPNLFTISHMVGEELSAEGVKNTVVVNGIDATRFRRKTSYEVGPRPFRIVMVGRLDHPWKGQDLLIEAVSKLRKRGVDLQVDIIGEGKSRKLLEAQIRHLRLGNMVNLLGARSQDFLGEHLADYDLVVQPSRIEGFGLTVAEAMAAGVPVLVSDLEPLMETIDGGECGYSFPAEDTDALADSILNIMLNYDDRFVEKGIERVRRLYDVTNTSAAYISEYEKIIARR